MWVNYFPPFVLSTFGEKTLGGRMYKQHSMFKRWEIECTNYIPCPNARWTNVQTTFLAQMLGGQMYKLHCLPKCLVDECTNYIPCPNTW